MPLDPLLIEILACPQDKGPLLWFEDEDLLYNLRLHRAYKVVDSIPVMLIDESIEVDEGEHQRLVAKAQVDGVRETGTPPSEKAEG
jgi:uncharacterized protein YbaR (Trm112 family)